MNRMPLPDWNSTGMLFLQGAGNIALLPPVGQLATQDEKVAPGSELLRLSNRQENRPTLRAGKCPLVMRIWTVKG
jgi:hypothetical protein